MDKELSEQDIMAKIYEALENASPDERYVKLTLAFNTKQVLVIYDLQTGNITQQEIDN